MAIDLTVGAPAVGLVCSRCGVPIMRFIRPNQNVKQYVDSKGQTRCFERQGYPHTPEPVENEVGSPNYFDAMRASAKAIGELVTGRVHPSIHDKVLEQVAFIDTYATELELQWEEDHDND